MKKLFVCTLVMTLGFTLVGCDEDSMNASNEIETTIEEITEVEETQEKVVEEIQDIQEPEEVVEEKDEFDEEELHYYLTTNLSNSEYKDYFDKIEWVGDTSELREIEFDAHIMFVNASEKYSTRCELMLASGDYNNGEFVGPYIKTKDMPYTQLKGLQEGSNVRVKVTIDGYDMNAGYLKVSVREISGR